MALIIGGTLALVVGALTTLLGMGRDRALYPAVTFVVASYYVLFAAMGASPGTLAVELAVGVVFIVAAAVGFRSSLWLVVVALAAHGAFDLVHGSLIVNPGVPAWWPAFCSAYDFVAAAYLAWLLQTARIRPAWGGRIEIPVG